MMAPLVVPPIAVTGVITAFDPANLHVAVGNATAVRRAVETGSAALASIHRRCCGGREQSGRAKNNQGFHFSLSFACLEKQPRQRRCSIKWRSASLHRSTLPAER